MAKKVFVTHQLPGERIHDLAQYCEMNVWMGPGLLSPQGLREELEGCQGLVCLLTDRIDRGLVQDMPDLEFISSMSVGVDHVDLPALNERGIPLGHTPGVLVNTTADLAFALLLASARRLGEADRFVRQGNWTAENAWSPDFFTGKDVSGATLGIVGLGEIGQAVARRAAGFDMRVLAWNRSPRDVPGVESVSLEELLLRSDFVSLHVALTPETRNLLGAEQINMMKPGAVLVNTARGGLVDEEALGAALSDGRVYAAGFDLSSATVEAIRGGWTDLVIDQQQWLQGYLPILQICLSHNYAFTGLHVDTGAGFAHADNVELLADLVGEQIR